MIVVALGELRLHVPEDWALVAQHDHALVRMFWRGSTKWDFEDGRVSTGGVELGIERLAATGDLVEVAFASIGKLQGEPERRDRTIASAGVVGYQWTDGVTDIWSLFVRTSTGIHRLDVVTPPWFHRFAAQAEAGRVAVDALLDSITVEAATG